MKNIQYNLSDSDIRALCYILEVMPSYNFIEEDNEINFSISLAASIVQKLICHKSLSHQETSFLAFALDCAFKALRNEISLSKDLLNGLYPYMFTINKLHPVFLPLL